MKINKELIQLEIENHTQESILELVHLSLKSKIKLGVYIIDLPLDNFLLSLNLKSSIIRLHLPTLSELQIFHHLTSDKI